MTRRARRLAEMAALGGLLFVGQRALTDAARSAPALTVVVPADASPAERARRVEEAMLVAEALRLDLLRHDPFVLHRVAANLAAVEGDPGGDTKGDVGEPEALLARATALGMLERDPLLRAHLLRRMRARGDVPALVARYATKVRSRGESRSREEAR